MLRSRTGRCASFGLTAVRPPSSFRIWKLENKPTFMCSSEPLYRTLGPRSRKIITPILLREPKLSIVLQSRALSNQKPVEKSTVPSAQTTACPEVAAPTSILRRTTELMGMYMDLSKFKLSSLVVITTMVGYYMAPASFLLDQFIYTSVGTSLAICAANSFNQIIETKLDSQMIRTSGRMLPSGKMSRTHAIAFGTAAGLAGCSLLFSQVNPVAGTLALGNILLYTLVYTPLKQKHPLNTWVGAIVGAIPPLIGWTAATGGAIDGGALTLASLLFLWQIPHFMSLSYMLKEDYKKAAYKMLSVTNEPAVAKAAWYWSLPMLGVGAASAASGMTSWLFALDSIPVNLYLLWLADKFRKQTDTPNAKKLFLGSVRFLPLLLLLMMAHKTNNPKSDEEKAENTETLGSMDQITS